MVKVHSGVVTLPTLTNVYVHVSQFPLIKILIPVHWLMFRWKQKAFHVNFGVSRFSLE